MISTVLFLKIILMIMIYVILLFCHFYLDILLQSNRIRVDWGLCWWDQWQLGRNCSCGERFWFWCSTYSQGGGLRISINLSQWHNLMPRFPLSVSPERQVQWIKEKRSSEFCGKALTWFILHILKYFIILRFTSKYHRFLHGPRFCDTNIIIQSRAVKQYFPVLHLHRSTNKYLSPSLWHWQMTKWTFVLGVEICLCKWSDTAQARGPSCSVYNFKMHQLHNK